jgi:hypothetical protein
MENLQKNPNDPTNSSYVLNTENPPPQTPARDPAPLRRGPRRRIDWGEVATLLADGVPTIEVAHFVGCSRQHVWRILRSSNALRLRLGEERARIAAECGSQIEGLRRTIADRIEREVNGGNIRVLLWAADRLGITNHALPSRQLGDGTQETLDTDAPYFDDALDPEFQPEPQPAPAPAPVPAPQSVFVGEATFKPNQTDKLATDAHGRLASPISASTAAKPQAKPQAKIDRRPKSATRKRQKPSASGAQRR